MIEKVYLVDDCEISLFLASSIIAFENFSGQIETFQAADEALHTLKVNIEQDALPRIIFLDLNMPYMSGWDFLDALAPYEPALQNKCLIYILSSSFDPEEKRRALEYPLVAGFLHKPLEGEDLNKIKSLYR